MKSGKKLSLNRKSNSAKKIKAGIMEELDWIKIIAKKMGVPGRTDLAYRALIAVLHSIRDNLDLQQVFLLSAYLPFCIRGVYFEGYDPDNVKVMIYNNQLLMSFRSRMGPRNGMYFEDYLDRNGKNKIDVEELLETIREKLDTVNTINPEVAFQAVLEVMYEKIPYEDAQVNSIINLLDLNTEFQIAD